jgi:hypothetical protein
MESDVMEPIFNMSDAFVFISTIHLIPIENSLQLLEKLIVAQLVKNTPPPPLMEPEGAYRVHKGPSLDPILSQLNPAHAFRVHALFL